MIIDLVKLEEIAKAAAEHEADGHWLYGPISRVVEVGYFAPDGIQYGGMCWKPDETIEDPEDPEAVAAIGRHMAAFSPVVVLSLIAYIKHLQSKETK